MTTSTADTAAPATAADTIAALDAADTTDPATAPEPADDDLEPDEEDGEGVEDLGDKGHKALARMKERLKVERAARRAAEQALAERDGDDETRRHEREALTKANQRILRSEIKAAAKGVLTDPSDAFLYLDLDQFDVDDDGGVDEDAITDAITDLVRSKPYLAAQGGTKAPKVDPSQGAVGGAPATAAQRFAAQMANRI